MCVGAEGPATPLQMLASTDFLYDLTNRNISDWLLKTHDRFIGRRYMTLLVIQNMCRQRPMGNLAYDFIQKKVKTLRKVGGSTDSKPTQDWTWVSGNAEYDIIHFSLKQILRKLEN